MQVPERLEFGIGSYNICGHYLVVTSSDPALVSPPMPGGASSQGRQSTGHDTSQDGSNLTIKLYLRPGFITDGLDGILNSPGTTVLLKGVDVLYMKGAHIVLFVHIHI